MQKLLFILSLVLLAACSSERSEEAYQLTISCDAEEVSGDELVAGDVYLKGGNSRSDKYARSGKYSVKIDNENPYGFSHIFTDIKEGDVIEVSAWRYLDEGIGSIVISDYDSENGVFERSTIVKEEVDGWGLVKCLFVASKDFDSIVTYALNNTETPAYFDDFEINAYFNNPKPDESFEALEITIPDAMYDTLVNRRNTAIDRGVITADLKEYVKASLTVDGEKFPVNLRLKGDWIDHLESNKWSFRIKIKGNHAYKGMKSFSIQNPNTRSFMNEWFAHQLYEQEDVLTTRYIFIPVIINGEKKGVYALEEHFDKQLLEYRERREGPIVKYNEDGMWQVNLHQSEGGLFYNAPSFASAEIVPFKKNRTRKSPVLYQQFKTAQWSMDRYRNHDPQVDDYLDINAMAKYMALTDVINGKHGQIWHNQRLYFNPITNKLEPIAFDCFGELNTTERKVEITGLKRKEKQHFTLLEAVLANPEMESKYLEYLKKYSSESFMDKAIKALQTEIKEVESMLQFEYPNCNLETEFFKNNGRQLREQLPSYVEFTKNPSQETIKEEPYQILPEGIIFTDIALKAFVRDTVEFGKFRIDLQNFHTSEITVSGYAVKGKKDSIIDLAKIKIDGFAGKPSEQILNCSEKPKWIFYTAANCGDKLFSYKLGKWDRPTRIQRIKKNTNWMVPAKDAGNKIIFSGNQVFNSDVFISEGYQVIIEAGTGINFLNGAGFISHSPVLIQGTKDAPVNIFSADNSASGFTVISNLKSTMDWVVFEGMNTMQKDNWTLTGAVTFYESDVTINHCQFNNNHCEDGLNLIRCTFEMQNSTVSGTFSDGFDADFCTGKVSNCLFKNTGNDAIDFSGSTIEIVDNTILNAGDKGVSGGEHSNLILEGNSIDGASIAIAAKDLTELDVSNCSIKNSDVVFAAFRKKPEYGPASIEAKNITLSSNKTMYLLELGSKLTLEGRAYVGKEAFDIDQMYANF